MKIACLQMDMQLGKPEENYRHATQMIADAMSDCPDVIVLPETWNTGFFPKSNLQAYCDADGRQTQELMRGLAQQHRVNIVAGSVSCLRGGNVYNTSYVFNRTGDCIATYDKTHLFSPMGENLAYKPGNSLCTFEMDGIACGLLICYDIRFPELVRTLALQGIQILFVVSQWPQERMQHLHSLLTARAIENQMIVVCCNSCGKTEDTVFGGGSMVLDAMGACIELAGDREIILQAEIEPTIIQTIRTSINVFRDRRPELYRL